MMFDYFDSVGVSIEFLIALGSLLGVLGLIVGIMGWVFLGQFQRHKMIGVIMGSVVLLILCGASTGFKYFHIYH